MPSLGIVVTTTVGQDITHTIPLPANHDEALSYIQDVKAYIHQVVIGREQAGLHFGWPIAYYNADQLVRVRLTALSDELDEDVQSNDIGILRDREVEAGDD